MKALVLNRAILVFGFIGLFIAGYMALSHALAVPAQCGPNIDCAAITNHPTAFWFGINVAYFGVIGYLLITGLAATRAIRGLDQTTNLVLPGLFLSLAGTMASLYLQYVAFIVIGAFCPWCSASAIAMVALLILSAMLVNVTEAGQAPARSGLDFFVTTGLACLLVLSLGVGAFGLQQQAPILRKTDAAHTVDYVPDGAHIFGNPNARVTIVEFADMYCPGCRVASPKVKEYVRNHPGKVRLVYRHFPLIDRHPLAVNSAIIGEAAAEKNRFFEWLEMVVSGENPPADGEALLDMARTIGLDRAELERRIADSTDSIYARVQRDIQAGNSLGVQYTPTFFILVDGTRVAEATSGDLFQKLEGREVQNVMRG